MSWKVRWLKLTFGFVLFVAGLCAIGYCVASRSEFTEGDGAGSIKIPVDHPLVPVGLLTVILFAFASAIVAIIGALVIRANWRSSVDH